MNREEHDELQKLTTFKLDFRKTRHISKVKVASILRITPIGCMNQFHVRKISKKRFPRLYKSSKKNPWYKKLAFIWPFSLFYKFNLPDTTGKFFNEGANK